MKHRKIILLAVIAFNLICLMAGSAFSQTNKPAPIEEVINTGNKSITEGDWVNAESNFREAIKLEPKQTLWRIQLTLALGHQKKWKEAFKEFDKVMELGVVDWVLTINKKMPEGNVAFVNTETFGEEKQGILRYVKAVKEKKKVDSVSNDIGDKLADFAKKNNLALIYDISKFKDTSFESGKTIDVTKDFIAYYNELYKE